MKKKIKKLLGIPNFGELSLDSFIRYKRAKYGRYFYKKKYTAKEIVDAMKSIGLKKDAVVMVHCSWNEFYNCSDKPINLINEILNVIGPNGTLLMPAYPLNKSSVFNVKRSATGAGILAETFRRYPGVRRSINVRHSVCAIGAMADYFLSEHHQGETCWDEKSPFFKLSQVGGLVFDLGLGKYWPGTFVHCVEALLRRDIKYYADMFCSTKTEYKYVDYDGEIKSYYNFDMPSSGKRMRMISYFKMRHIVKKYLNAKYAQVSNLVIARYDVSYALPTLVRLAKEGKDIYMLPLKVGYKFNN